MHDAMTPRPYGPEDADWPAGTDGQSWPKTREGYLRWLAGRIEGYGNDAVEPIRSLREDGYLTLVQKKLSTPARITEAGRAYLLSLDAERAAA